MGGSCCVVAVSRALAREADAREGCCNGPWGEAFDV
jgi:hypothetical protein